MKNLSEQAVSPADLTTFFEGLANRTNSAKKSYTADLRAFFTGLGPAVRIAQRAQNELDRRAATRFSSFDFFRVWETDLSRVFGELLDPNGTHGQGDTFLRLFLDEVRQVNKNVGGYLPSGHLGDSQIDLEYRTDKGRSIDIVIRVRDIWIGIENKPWAVEQSNQISDYFEYLRETGPDALLVYLSGSGRPPETLPVDEGDKMRCPTLPFRDAERDSPSLENWVRKCRSECEAERVRWFLTDLLEYIMRNWFAGYYHDTRLDPE